MATTSMFSISVSLFLFHRYVHLCQSLDSTYKWYMVSVFVWLTSLTIFSRSIHVVANGIISFFFYGWAVFHCVYMYIVILNMHLGICHTNFLEFCHGLFALLMMFCFFECSVILYCKCIVKGISSVVIMHMLIRCYLHADSEPLSLNRLWLPLTGRCLSLDPCWLRVGRHSPQHLASCSHHLPFVSAFGTSETRLSNHWDIGIVNMGYLFDKWNMKAKK